LERPADIARFFEELGHLKRVQRSGWWLAGVESAESVAEHSFRAAAIAFVLAELEGADPFRAAAMALFHDLPEARVNDMHRLGKRYAPWAGVEERVLEDQSKLLPAPAAERLRGLGREYRDGKSPEARAAKDADRLECLFQAREYLRSGHSGAEPWVRSSLAELATESAKRIANESAEAEPGPWWKQRDPT
jgi:putative hydrolase of HD superfamily